MASVILENVSVFFGKNHQRALEMARDGQSRFEIKNKTNTILGVYDCSLEVHDGETLVLMGASGSGKSTLLRTINRLIKPVAGQIYIGENNQEIEISRASSKDLRLVRMHLISMVFQKLCLLPWRNVADNIGLGLEIAKYSKKQRQEIIAKQLELIGLKEWGNRFVTELSDCMQQRVGLARAFATHAPILLMDEPFSALDPLIRSYMQDELLHLQQKLNKTLIFVCHDLEEAIKMGDRIAIMDDGRILQCGTPQEILFNPANAHIANFVRHINPFVFLTAQDIMQPLTKDNAFKKPAAIAKADTNLRDIINTFDKKSGVIGVLKNGRIIGVITQQDIIHHLAKLQQH